jgi:hypothetical protein
MEELRHMVVELFQEKIQQKLIDLQHMQLDI